MQAYLHCVCETFQEVQQFGTISQVSKHISDGSLPCLQGERFVFFILYYKYYINKLKTKQGLCERSLKKEG